LYVIVNPTKITECGAGTRQMTGKIFINYRRGDDAGNTGRLRPRMMSELFIVCRFKYFLWE
jgi:hypothetical protein